METLEKPEGLWGTHDALGRHLLSFALLQMQEATKSGVRKGTKKGGF